jgi:hypothetical protein
MAAKQVSMGVDALAVHYHLDRPLRSERRTHSRNRVVWSIVGGLACIIFGGIELYAGFNSRFSYLVFARQPGISTFIVDGFLFVVGIAVLLFTVSEIKDLRFLAWECEEGFLELDHKGSLVWRKFRIAALV